MKTEHEHTHKFYMDIFFSKCRQEDCVKLLLYLTGLKLTESALVETMHSSKLKIIFLICSSS